MEKQYSVQFFTSFVENLQDVCRNYLNFNQFVEVSGYLCVEIDNMKKERYVLSELLQNSGNVVSESYCTKVFKTSRSFSSGNAGGNVQSGDRPRPWQNRNTTNTQARENVFPQNQNRRRSWAESSASDNRNVPSKVRRSSEVIEIEDDTQSTPKRENRNISGQYYSPQANVQQGQRWPAERTSVQRTPQNPVSVPRKLGNPIRHQGQHTPMSRTQYGPMVSQEQNRPLPRPAGSGAMQQTQNQGLGTGRVILPNNQSQKQGVIDHGNIAQFNVQKPPPSPVSNVSQAPVVKSEFYSQEGARSMSTTAPLKPEQRTACPENSNIFSPAATSNLPQSFNTGNHQAPEQTANNVVEMDKKIKSEPVASECSFPSGFDEDEIIDLDLFDDELEDIQPEASFPGGSKDDQAALARDYGMSGAPLQRKEGLVNPGTQKVVMYAVKQFKSYHFNKSGIEVDPFAIEPEQLDGLLLDFYIGVRKMNGDELNARTLKNVQIHLDMYLREQGYCLSIAKDEKFHASRDFVKKRLDSYMATQKFTPVDDKDIEQLFQKRVFGAHSADALFNTMWFLNTKFFAIKRTVEHFNLKWGDIQVRTDPSGLEYLERRISDQCSLKVFPKLNNPAQCFVNMYRKYYQLRPQESLYDSCPFYLHSKNTSFSYSEHWFSNHPMAWARFQNLWRRLVIAGGLSPNKKIM